jgi:hypothetical protein
MENNRHRFNIGLYSSFCKALDKSIAGLNWHEKEQFLLSMIAFTELYGKEQESVGEFYTQHFARVFKAKLQPALRNKLFAHYDKDLCLSESGVIDVETFNALPTGEQGLTDEEFPLMLNNYLRYLKTAIGMHYVFEPEESTVGEAPSQENENTPELKGLTKGRPTRSSGDNLTRLNMEQTALLIDYLKQGRFILKGEYLQDKSAGTAFHLLTGYSVNTLRQTLSAKGIAEVKTKSNLKELYNAITHLTILIKNDIRE